MKKFLVLFFVVSILSSISTQSQAREWVLVAEGSVGEVYMEQESISQGDTRFGDGYRATMLLVRNDKRIISRYMVGKKECKAQRGTLDIYTDEGVFVDGFSFKIGDGRLLSHIANVLCKTGKDLF